MKHKNKNARARSSKQAQSIAKLNQVPRSSHIRRLIIIPFLLEIVAVVGIVGYLSFRNGQQAINRLVYKLQDEVADEIIDHLEHFLEKAHLINQINGDTVHLGELSLQNLPAFEHHFWRQFQSFEEVNSIYLGTEQGEVIGIDSQHEGNLVTKVTEGFPRRNFYLLDESGKRTQLFRSQPSYDPRLRPWYIQAKKARRSIWSPVYPFANMKALGMTAALPIYDRQDNLSGVFAVDISLAALSNFLRQNSISPTSQIFIMERSGLLVASSTDVPPSLMIRRNKQLERLPAHQSKSSLIRAAADYLSEHFDSFQLITAPEQIDFWWQGKRQLVRAVPYRDRLGLDWLVVLVVPEADFLGEIKANTYRTMILCLLALAIAIVIGLDISYRIGNPIQKLSQASYKMQQKKFHQKVKTRGIWELEVLADSFNQMSQEIAEYSRSLEQKVSERTAALEKANQELRHLNAIDSLTKIANRRCFDQYLAQEWKRMAREQNPLSLILFDVDYFKLYNDEYGHQAGDDCLQRVAHASSDIVKRPADLVARYGGEEFAVILPNTDLEGTIQVGEKIRLAVKNCRLNHDKSPVGEYISISVGVASIIPIAKYSPKYLIAQADKALYAAKKQGRDRVSS